MKLLLLLGLLAVFAHLFVPSTADLICPNRCQRNRQLAINDCEDYESDVYAMCEVERCAGGFTCKMPDNTFLVRYNDLFELEAVIEYTWSPERRDLDTSTRLNGVDDSNVGFQCGSNTPYLRFGGDQSSYGGTEVVVADIQLAAETQFDDNVSIDLYAGWHGSENHGPAQVSLYLRRKDNGAVVTGTILSTRINPGNQRRGCASTHVARIVYFHGYDDSRFSLHRM